MQRLEVLAMGKERIEEPFRARVVDRLTERIPGLPWGPWSQLDDPEQLPGDLWPQRSSSAGGPEPFRDRALGIITPPVLECDHGSEPRVHVRGAGVHQAAHRARLAQPPARDGVDHERPPREVGSKSVPALEEPVEYGTTELAFVAGVALDLRVRPWNHLGFNLMGHFGFPAPPSAPFDTARSQVGLGVTWAW